MNSSHAPPCEFLLGGVPIEVEGVTLVIAQREGVAAFDDLAARQTALIGVAVQMHYVDFLRSNTKTVLLVSADWENEELWPLVSAPHDPNHYFPFL
jgi:hypothetical protein